MAPGIFSPGGLDKGTAVLLDEAPEPPATGTFLDLGCGWGPIALSLALRSPAATVWALDVNERALDLTRRTAAALGLDGVRATTADGIPDDVRFDLIWSNPPIRVGKAVLHELLRTWLPRLAPGGVGPPRGAAQPGLGQPAAVDRDRAGDAVHPADLEQGLPGARGEAAMTETTVPALGVVLVPTLPPEALRPLAVAADRHLDELWLWEDCFKESSIAAAGAALAWTERVRVGIGLAPVPLRNVALLAMELATLHRLFPGRLLPGIGHGVQDWMGQVGARPPHR